METLTHGEYPDAAKAETFTDRCRRLLKGQPNQGEFTLSRAGLETLVSDSERYGKSNKVANELLLTARDIASDTTMLTSDSHAWSSGQWDDHLPRILRRVADHQVKTIAVLNREQGIDRG